MRVIGLLLDNDNVLEKENLAAACFRFTPQISLGERSIFLEIEACLRLYSEQNLLLRLQALKKRFEVKIKIAVANDLPTALALAFYGVRTKEQLPIEALQIYASPFRLSRSLEKTVQTFKRLGIRTLGDLKVIPRSSIASRLGKEGLIAIQYVGTAKHIPWPRFYPQEKIQESDLIDDSYQVKELEPLLFILRKQIDKSLLRLRGAHKLAAEIEIRIHLEKYSTVVNPLRSWRIELSFPQGSVIGLLPIVKERLERTLQKDPLESPVCQLEFEITKSVYGSSKQRDFFSKKEEEDESFRAIVARLTEKLGFDKAFFANPLESYLPEKSWEKSLNEPRVIETPVPERPLRVLKTPQKIFKLDDYFQIKRRKWKVTEILGPERLSGDWWFAEKERDYYRVYTESGEELWIFTTRDSRDYFLHGIFD